MAHPDLAKNNRPNLWQDLPKPLVYLAPMSGVTNMAYRQMVKKFASDILFPEFISIYAMHYASEDPESRTMNMLEFDPAIERPIIAQIFGSEPELFNEAAKKMLELGFDGVDINFGCPAPKVAKNGGGCALLGDLDLSRNIIEAVLDAVGGQIPVSVKTRMSYKNVHVRDFCKKIADLPIENIAIHGRTFERPYEGKADLECVKEAKTLVPFLVTASGSGHSPEEAKAALDYTGADGIALARGTFGKPWLGKQIKDYIATGEYHEPDFAEVLDIMVEHAKLASANSARPFVEMRKVLAWYVKSIPNAAKYRGQLVRVKSMEDVENVVAEIKIDSAA